MEVLGVQRPGCGTQEAMTHHLLLLKFPPDMGCDLSLFLQGEKEEGDSRMVDPKRDWETEVQRGTVTHQDLKG